MAAQSPAQVRWILYFALWASTIVYIVVAQVAGPQGELDPMFPLFLTVAALGTAVATMIAPRILRDRALARLKLPTKEIEVPSDSPILRNAGTKVRAFANAGQARAQALAAAQSSWILGLGLAEAVAVHGLILRLLGASWTVAAPFFVISWVLFGAQAPRDKPVFDALERVAGAKLIDS